MHVLCFFSQMFPVYEHILIMTVMFTCVAKPTLIRCVFIYKLACLIVTGIDSWKYRYQI